MSLPTTPGRTSTLAAALITTAALVASCASTGGPTAPMACDDSIKSTFKPDARTTVVAVRQLEKGEPITAPDAPTPITAAADMCLVKLLVGPGATAEKDKAAKSYSEGIGIEVWLPAHANWNDRIRNYGGGGWVGGGHRYADKIGSKVPAIVNANMGYASGTTDAGQPWYQDGSFAFLSNGKVNAEVMRDFSVRAMVEQAVKTKALVQAYYGKAPKYTYFDGHSQGGRQGMKIAQEYPELYDGYMIGQPALSIPQFGTTGIYPQLVIKIELGFTAADKDKAADYAKKVEAVNKLAVASCDKEKLGFLLDPFACNYDPLKDAAALCAGVQGDASVSGSNADAATCMSAKEATALNKIWYGATNDGSHDAAQPADSRSGKSLGPKQVWWTFTKGSGIGRRHHERRHRQPGPRDARRELCRRRRHHPRDPDPEHVDHPAQQVDIARLRRPGRSREAEPGPTSHAVRQPGHRQPRPEQAAQPGQEDHRAQRSGRRRDPARRQHPLSRARGRQHGRPRRGAEVHAHVPGARRGAQFTGARVHGRRQQQQRAAAEAARQCEPEPDARAGPVLHGAGGLGREGLGAGGDRADVARRDGELAGLCVSEEGDLGWEGR
jgi:Tannase and feruloyl esterase